MLRGGEPNAVWEPIMGPRSIYLLDGDIHARLRKLVVTSLHLAPVQQYPHEIAEIVERAIQRRRNTPKSDLMPLVKDISLEVLLRFMLGGDSEWKDRPTLLRSHLLRLAELGTTKPRLFMSPWLGRDLGSWSPGARFRGEMAEHDLVLAEHIQARARDPEPHDRHDVLSLLLRARDEDGTPLSGVELRDQLVTLLLAGYEPLPTALAASFGFLRTHPEALARLGEDGEQGENGFLEAVVKETLRLRPGRTVAPRRLAASTEICGYQLPRGTQVSPSIYLIHRRPELYPDPLVFRPERFLDGPIDYSAWIPFGGGSRRCPAASFVMSAMKAVLAAAAPWMKANVLR